MKKEHQKISKTKEEKLVRTLKAREGSREVKSKRYLRRKVLRRATESLHGSSVCDALLAEAKVGDLHMAVFIQHQVFQLEWRQNTEVPTNFTNVAEKT